MRIKDTCPNYAFQIVGAFDVNDVACNIPLGPAEGLQAQSRDIVLPRHNNSIICRCEFNRGLIEVKQQNGGIISPTPAPYHRM